MDVSSTDYEFSYHDSFIENGLGKSCRFTKRLLIFTFLYISKQLKLSKKLLYVSQ